MHIGRGREGRTAKVKPMIVKAFVASNIDRAEPSQTHARYLNLFQWLTAIIGPNFAKYEWNENFENFLQRMGKQTQWDKFLFIS